MNSEHLDYIAGSEFCATGTIAVDAFVSGGLTARGGFPLAGDIKDLLNGNPYKFYEKGFIRDKITGKIVYTFEGGVIVGGNLVLNGVDAEISVSPGTNYTIEIWNEE